VFVSGQVARDAQGAVVGQTMTEQANAALDNIEDVLSRTDATLADVVKVTYYLTDISDLDALRAVLALRLPQPPPAATLVGVQALIDPRFLIEIDAVAAT
jgi:2-iminobutanoate/2-iminopropanoate deaminase